MKPISYFVETELLQDEIALDALKRGILNMSQYAKYIQPRIAHRRLEDVSLGSIITALSRLSEKHASTHIDCEQVVFDQISLFRGLTEITYRVQQIPDTLLQQIFAVHEQSEDFFELTVGKNEITFITIHTLASQIQDIVQTVEPLVVLDRLIGITFRFSADFFHEYGILYSILRVFALEHVSVVEFVSTYREATVILSEDDLDKALQLVKRFFSKKI